MSGVEEVGAALTAIGVGAQVSGQEGGLQWSSDQATYPKELTSVGTAAEIDIRAAEFFCGATEATESKTVFNMKGNFSQSPPVMANVHFYKADSTTYYDSTLTFQAKLMETPYGTGHDPKIHFECTGRFDPAGPGDADFTVTLEVNTLGQVNVVPSPIIQDHSLGASTDFRDFSPNGFYLGIA